MKRLFYLRIGQDSYWACPPFVKAEGLEWLHSNKQENKSFERVYWDDLPKEVQHEYLLWLMSDRKDEYDKQVDKH